MELGESAAEGAARETMEEAQADVEVVGHFAHLDIPVIGQVRGFFSRFLRPSSSPFLWSVNPISLIAWNSEFRPIEITVQLNGAEIYMCILYQMSQVDWDYRVGA